MTGPVWAGLEPFRTQMNQGLFPFGKFSILDSSRTHFLIPCHSVLAWSDGPSTAEIIRVT